MNIEHLRGKPWVGAQVSYGGGNRYYVVREVNEDGMLLNYYVNGQLDDVGTHVFKHSSFLSYTETLHRSALIKRYYDAINH